MTNRVRRSLCFAAVAALPFTVGVGTAHAESVSAGQDRLYVGNDSQLAGDDQLLVDLRAGRTDDDGDATGVRSRTNSSDVQDVQDVRTDTRTVSNDEGSDSTSGRVILGFDDIKAESIDSDIDLVMVDQNDEPSGQDASGSPAGQRDGAADEEQNADDAAFVFGQ